MNHDSDLALATRIEREAAAMQREYAEAHARLFPELSAAWVEVGGGVAAVLEAESPANGAFNVGMAGEVTAEEFDALARFFRDHGERAGVTVCPLSHPSLAERVERAGWVAVELEHVLARALDSGDAFESPPSDVELRLASSDDDLELWAALVASGFSAPDDPIPAEMRLARAAASAPGRHHLIASVGGVPAGTGELRIAEGTGWLSADTTLPHLRRRGVQGALQRARLELARDAGCDLAVTESLPGTASQRNMERLGFRIVYTRVKACEPAHPAERT